jgi:hypothetical protein
MYHKENMIEETIDFTVKKFVPSTGDNLLGMDYDICHFFGKNDAIRFLSRNKSGDKKCMFSIELEATNCAMNINDVTSALRGALDNIVYKYFESSSIQMYKEKMVLRFVTVIGENQFYVTGEAIVSGDRYRQLASDYEKGFR